MGMGGTDVISHSRGNHENNILIMEVKTYWNDDNPYDLDKTRECMDIDGEYRFPYGASFIIGRRLQNVNIDLFTRCDSDEGQ